MCRPVLINGIPNLLARGDLADRSLTVTLPVIPDDRRRDEAAVGHDFDAARPGILGALLDGLVTALRRLPDLHLPKLPRMADFARVACAAHRLSAGQTPTCSRRSCGTAMVWSRPCWNPIRSPLPVQVFAAEAADLKAASDRELILVMPGSAHGRRRMVGHCH